MSDKAATEPLRFDRRLTVKLPLGLEVKLHEAATATVSTTSSYARTAILEKLTRDGFSPSASAA